jgi:Flp pilus assembly protein TadG
MCLLKKIDQLKKCQSGLIMLTEFAVSLPVLITLFIGSFEVSRYIIVLQKVDRASYSIADMIAGIDATDTSAQKNPQQLAQQYAGYLNKFMTPYTGSGSVSTMSATKKSGQLETNWGSGIPIDDKNLVDGESIIAVKVSYTYEPVLDLGYLNLNFNKITKTSYVPARYITF